MKTSTITFPDGTSHTKSNNDGESPSNWALVSAPHSTESLREIEDQKIREAHAMISTLSGLSGQADLEFEAVDFPAGSAAGRVRRATVPGTKTSVLVDDDNFIVQLDAEALDPNGSGAVFAATEITAAEGLVQQIDEDVAHLQAEVVEAQGRLDELAAGADARTTWRVASWCPTEESAIKLQSSLARHGRSVEVHRVDGHLNLSTK